MREIFEKTEVNIPDYIIGSMASVNPADRIGYAVLRSSSSPDDENTTLRYAGKVFRCGLRYLKDNEDIAFYICSVIIDDYPREGGSSFIQHLLYIPRFAIFSSEEEAKQLVERSGKDDDEANKLASDLLNWSHYLNIIHQEDVEYNSGVPTPTEGIPYWDLKVNKKGLPREAVYKMKLSSGETIKVVYGLPKKKGKKKGDMEC